MITKARAFRTLLAPAVITLALGLSACTVTPLYSSAPAGTTLQAELAAISVLPASDRLTQIARRELNFAFTGGNEPVAPLYELSLQADVGGGGLNPTAPGNVGTTALSVSLRFTLVEIATGQVIETGRPRAYTRYQGTNQASADMLARRDAEERATIEAAEMVRLQIASALAVR